ncbi:MAG: NAD(P)/FAD-dependent oxidoreductase [Myxococcaceae bacterium]
MRADVVIVGAGVVGCSVAYHLAQAGGWRVTVVDRGDGSTERATGGFRAQFATSVNVKLSLLSLQKLLCFADETGVEPGYRPCGYLFIAAAPSQLQRLREALAVQRAAGSDAARELSPQEVRACNPYVVPEAVAGGTFSPVDGFLRPTEIQRGYREAAARLGVRFVQSTVRSFRRLGNRIVEVGTDAQALPCGAVVNAAGPWAAAVAQLAAADVPVTPLRRQVAVTVPTDALPEAMPMTVFADGFHCRVRDGRVLLLQPSAPAKDLFDISVDPLWVASVLEAGRARVPSLRGIPVASAYAGLYEMSPDEHALLGLADGFENFFLVNGSSGHGVMHAPALGQLAAELLSLGKARSLDISALRPSRFSEGEPNPLRPLL